MASGKVLPVSLSPRIAIGLSVVMILVSLLTFTHIPDADGPDLPVLTTLRDKRSYLHMTNHRAQNTPAWLYKGAKGTCSILWNILIPLQHSSRIRSRWPNFHRRSGWLTVMLSVELGVSGYYMLTHEMITSHEKWYYIHSLYNIPIPLLSWPTFELTVHLLGPPYFYSLYKLVTAVQAKNIESHRRWAVMHSALGYTVAIARFFSLLVVPLGLLLHKLPQHIQYDWLQLPHDIDGKVDVEIAALAWCMFAATVLSAYWIYAEFRKAGLVESRLAGSWTTDGKKVS